MWSLNKMYNITEVKKNYVIRIATCPLKSGHVLHLMILCSQVNSMYIYMYYPLYKNKIGCFLYLSNSSQRSRSAAVALHYWNDSTLTSLREALRAERGGLWGTPNDDPWLTIEKWLSKDCLIEFILISQRSADNNNSINDLDRKL